jgi:regulatory protein
MFGKKPRQLDSETELYDAAVKALIRRAHSVHEMKQKLERRAEDKSLVKNVLDRLKQNGLIDDARYAKQFTRQRTEVRRQGQFRISRDLRGRGIPDRHISAAMEESAQTTDAATVVRERIARKLKLFRGEIDDKKMASLYRSLLRLGFPSDIIRRELKAMTREELPEVEMESE